MNARILVTRQLPPAAAERLATLGLVTLLEAPAPEALAAAVRDADILLPTITDRIDAAVLVPGGRLCLVANFGAGTEHIDLAAARVAGIPVTNTPDALTDATAEIAVLLMLMAARRAGEGERQVRSGAWAGWKPTALMGQSLSGKLLGLVGFGRIARATARRARAFGMDIAWFGRTPPPDEIAAELGARRVATLEQLAAEADVLSLHVPGGDGTRHLVNAPLLAAMKPTAILVNTARGSVVDEAALAEALSSGRIAAAGLDVYEREPVVHPGLLGCENAVLLPHLGSATLETRTAMGMQALDNIVAHLAGQPLPNRIA